MIMVIITIREIERKREREITINLSGIGEELNLTHKLQPPTSPLNPADPSRLQKLSL